MQALRDNIIVKRIAGEKTTTSGLILKKSDEPDKGLVESLGPKVDEVSVGDIILVNWNAATKIENESYVVPIGEVIFIYE